MRRRSNIAGNPVLIGAATVLIIVVAVFLSYNANSGLPFVPSYELDAEVPSGANLVVGNDVRIGGARVGAVQRIEPIRRANGELGAKLTMKLERSVYPLPRDSTVIVRPRSALGLKFVEITRGTGQEGFEDGDTIPIRNATPDPVEFDEFVNIFEERVRRAQQENFEQGGDALAGRGDSLNAALGELPPLLEDLLPVLRNLRSRETDLEGFITALARTARAVAPVAEQQAALFRNLDTTFAALDAVRPQIQASITEGRLALEAGIRDLPAVRPFLRNSSAFFGELRPGISAFRRGAPILTGALVAGTPTLRRTPALNRRLASLLTETGAFARDPAANRGITRLRQLTASLRPTLEFLAPTQTNCNYIALWFRNVASLLSEGDANGTWQRFIAVSTPTGRNNEGGPSSGPASGPSDDNYLHSNPYPNTGAPGQVDECEAGNEIYLNRRVVVGNVPGNQGKTVDGKP